MKSGGRRGEGLSGSEGITRQHLLTGMIGHHYLFQKKCAQGEKVKEKADDKRKPKKTNTHVLKRKKMKKYKKKSYSSLEMLVLGLI